MTKEKIKELIIFQEKKINQAYDYMFSLGYMTDEELAVGNHLEIEEVNRDILVMRSILLVLKHYEIELPSNHW